MSKPINADSVLAKFPEVREIMAVKSALYHRLRTCYPDTDLSDITQYPSLIESLSINLESFLESKNVTITDIITASLKSNIELIKDETATYKSNQYQYGDIYYAPARKFEGAENTFDSSNLIYTEAQDVGNLTTMNYLFNDCDLLNETVELTCNKCRVYDRLFYGNKHIKNVIINSTAPVNDCKYTFYGCDSLKSVVGWPMGITLSAIDIHTRMPGCWPSQVIEFKPTGTVYYMACTYNSRTEKYDGDYVQQNRWPSMTLDSLYYVAENNLNDQINNYVEAADNGTTTISSAFRLNTIMWLNSTNKATLVAAGKLDDYASLLASKGWTLKYT